MFFRIKRSTQLRKLMTAYCDRQSVDLNSIAFLFDGRRLRGDQTPDEVNFFSFLFSIFFPLAPITIFCCLILLLFLGFAYMMLDVSFYFFWCSSKWRMGMKLMPCCTKLVADIEQPDFACLRTKKL